MKGGNPNRAMRRKKERDLKRELKSKPQTPKVFQQLPEQLPLRNKVAWHFHLLKIPNWIWKAFLALGAILTVLCGVYTFHPFVSVEPNPETSTADYSDTKFKIINLSQFPIYHIQYFVLCWNGDLPEDAYGRHMFYCRCIQEQNELMAHGTMSARVGFPDGITPNGEYIRHQEISRPFYDFYVTFTAVGIKFHRGFRFWAYKGEDGKYIWIQAGEASVFKPDKWPRLNYPR
jgi:hypothetical protein